MILILTCDTAEQFLSNSRTYFTPEIINDIEIETRGQSQNSAGYEFRKGIITASKAHDVKTKMVKIKNEKGGFINMWSLIQRISGLITKPHLPALIYGRENEPFAAV